jgi:hypothetical protein
VNISDFETLLADLLARQPEVNAARTWADAGFSLFGIQVKLDGAVVNVRLTRGSPPAGGTGDPVMRDTGEEQPDPAPLDPQTARQVEMLLERTLLTGGVPQLAWVMSFADRAAERQRAKPVSSRTQAGVVAHMEDGTEYYLTLNS